MVAVRRGFFLKAMSGTRGSGSLPRQVGHAARVLTEHSSSHIDGMRVIQERNSSNTPTVAYTRGNNLSGSLEGAGGIGGFLTRSHGYSSGTWSTHNHYHADGNGNVTFLVNSGQTAEAWYRYDPYGRTMAQSGNLATANVYRFSSKEIHSQSGMYYYGFRFYDPHLQRWPNRDPIGELGGVNLYAIVNNAVLDSMDPLGLRAGGGVGGGGFTGGQVCPQGLYGSMGNASDIARYAPGHFEFPEPFHPGKPRNYSPSLFWPPRTWPDPANPGCNCGMWPADPPGGRMEGRCNHRL